MLSHYTNKPRTVDKHTAITKLDFLRTKIVMKLLVLGVFVVILSLFYIWSRIQIVQLGYEINELTHEQKNILNDNRNYKIELLLMKSPEKIQKYALNKLHMITPKPEDIVLIESEEPKEEEKSFLW